MHFVARHGRRFYAGGAVHCFFGDKERHRLRDDGFDQDWLDRLDGVVVVMELDFRTISTVYRNRNALKLIRKKAA